RLPVEGSEVIEKIIIADHHGFCMGVKRAIQVAEETKGRGVENVTILKEIVHNNAVVEKFRAAGVKQALDIEGGTVIVSAHGVAPAIMDRARDRGLEIIDATCPLVTRIHDIVDRLVEKDFNILHFGDHQHDETMGVVGHAPEGRITVIPDIDVLLALPDEMPERLALTSQATAEAERFEEIERKAEERWPQIKVFNTICNATNQRQSAIIKMAPTVDVTLVVGSDSSANSRRLTSIAETLCDAAFLIDSEADIRDQWFTNDRGEPARIVGISAGASTPEFLVEGVVDRLLGLSAGEAEVIRPARQKRENNLALQED
ncbi:MAG: 4-hydroxy-3-methylbut-2-enyl diphosphate reductase, partial [Candidatus Zixiibacteriota bacterium]